MNAQQVKSNATSAPAEVVSPVIGACNALDYELEVTSGLLMTLMARLSDVLSDAETGEDCNARPTSSGLTGRLYSHIGRSEACNARLRDILSRLTV